MKRTAVLLDLGFALYKLYKLLGDRHPTAQEVCDFAKKCLNSDEELFRIYCYHCLPYSESETHPITRATVDFSKTQTYRTGQKFISDLRVADYVAFRSGELSFDGWTIKKRAAQDIIKTGRVLQPSDIEPDLKQKLVDMKIGLDVAWLASKSIVERIILVTADSDFIPAMKFARREGVQVILVTLGHKQVKQTLKEHADELRQVSFP
jgi:uncharacterized LabA/DUF88 family protein